MANRLAFLVREEMNAGSLVTTLGVPPRPAIHAGAAAVHNWMLDSSVEAV